MLDKFKKYKKWIDRIVIWLFAFSTLEIIYRTLNASSGSTGFIKTLFTYHELDGDAELYFLAVTLFITYWIFIGFKSKSDHWKQYQKPKEDK